MELSKGGVYDLNDLNFGWRGKYRILKQDPNSELIHIENLMTHSKQYVSASRLRLSQCDYFSIKWDRKR
jgi:hypothetical protein